MFDVFQVLAIDSNISAGISPKWCLIYKTTVAFFREQYGLTRHGVILESRPEGNSGHPCRFRGTNTLFAAHSNYDAAPT